MPIALLHIVILGWNTRFRLKANRLWYELSFRPPGAPGAYQLHEVRVPNRADLTVVARPGHVVPD